MLIHTPNPCDTCPFRVELQGAFDPETLDASVGDNLRGEHYAHRCHKTLGRKHENVCVGFLRYVQANGIYNRMVQMGICMGVIDYSQISDSVDIHLDWDVVLDNHAQAIG